MFLVKLLHALPIGIPRAITIVFGAGFEPSHGPSSGMRFGRGYAITGLNN